MPSMAAAAQRHHLPHNEALTRFVLRAIEAQAQPADVLRRHAGAGYSGMGGVQFADHQVDVATHLIRRLGTGNIWGPLVVDRIPVVAMERRIIEKAIQIVPGLFKGRILLRGEIHVKGRRHRDRFRRSSFQSEAAQLAGVEVDHLFGIGRKLPVLLVAGAGGELLRHWRLLRILFQRVAVKILLIAGLCGEDQRFAIGTDHRRDRTQADRQESQPVANAIETNVDRLRLLRGLGFFLVGRIRGRRRCVRPGFGLRRGLLRRSEKISELVFAISGDVQRRDRRARCRSSRCAVPSQTARTCHPATRQ